MKSKLSLLSTLLWLHLIRTSRYMTGIINWGIVDALWISIYVLGALVFTIPQNYQLIAPLLFWAILAWNLLSTPVWTIGNWMQFYVNMGLYEEHEITGVSHSVFLSFRVIPSIIVALISAGFVAYLVKYVAKTNVLVAANPLVLALSLVAILLIATSYSLILAYSALVTEAPAPMLDFLNFLLFIIGGVGVPVSSLPSVLRYIAILTPYSHPAELMRWASVGMTPYLGLEMEAIVTIVFVIISLTAAYASSKIAHRKARLNGIRGIGRT